DDESGELIEASNRRCTTSPPPTTTLFGIDHPHGIANHLHPLPIFIVGHRQTQFCGGLQEEAPKCQEP
ncbi:hypothetical protein U1Q18_049335, partial [Sarracenia purpurea var. burkii]